MDFEKHTTYSEYDQNGQLLCTIEGNTVSGLKIVSASSHARDPRWFVNKLIEIFLPTGYPHCVSPDYLGYQIYDSLQAFASSLANLFANRAVLAAIGVGDNTTTSTSALFLKIIQDIASRLATIWFAWDLGTALEPECKKYRFVADLVNDAAILFDCLTPFFSFNRNARILLLCCSGILRSCCGVLAGGSRAALTLHFTDPEKGSIADVNAKDQSQETVINLLGTLVGSVVVGLVPGEGYAMWVTVLALVAVHLWTNHQAVAHVVMRYFNGQRANIVFSRVLASTPQILDSLAVETSPDIFAKSWLTTPSQAAAAEQILQPSGVLHWYTPSGSSISLGSASFGSFTTVCSHLPPTHGVTDILNACDSLESGYALSLTTHRGLTHVDIALLDTERDSSHLEQPPELVAWTHALMLAHVARNDPFQNYLKLIKDSRAVVASIFKAPGFLPALQASGWEVDKSKININATIFLRVTSAHTQDA